MPHAMVGKHVSFLPDLARYPHRARSVNVTEPWREYFGIVGVVFENSPWLVVVWNEHGQQFIFLHREEITGLEEK